MTSWWCGHAWVEGEAVRDVRVVAKGALVGCVQVGVPAEPGDTRWAGLALPGFANAHSHAFHRALRGRAGRPGSFWTWRDAMYRVAGRLDPDTYRALATAVYAEMALAGVTAVGEFHYVHHDRSGRRYADPHEMTRALAEAAAVTGVRLTLLDTCYLAGGFDRAVDGVQARFADADVDAWAARSTSRPRSLPGDVRLGAALHSVRAVPRAAMGTVATVAREQRWPLHVHLSEQQRENDGCRAATGMSPAGLLAAEGVLAPSTTAVHATHVDTADIGLLGRSTTAVCLCPTTERDLADGIGPGRALAAAGVPLSLGSDSHAVIDLLEEARAVEMHERLAGGVRGAFATAALVAALTSGGHAALGRPEAGRIAAGAPLDLVHLRLDSVRTAGVDPRGAVLAAGAADVADVVVGGRAVVEGGVHVVGNVPRMLASAVAAVAEPEP